MTSGEGGHWEVVELTAEGRSETEGILEVTEDSREEVGTTEQGKSTGKPG